MRTRNRKAPKLQLQPKRYLDTVKVSIVVAVITTAVILYCNPWTLLWYPPAFVSIGAIIGGVTNALLTCVEVNS